MIVSKTARRRITYVSGGFSEKHSDIDYPISSFRDIFPFKGKANIGFIERRKALLNVRSASIKYLHLFEV